MTDKLKEAFRLRCAKMERVPAIPHDEVTFRDYEGWRDNPRPTYDNLDDLRRILLLLKPEQFDLFVIRLSGCDTMIIQHNIPYVRFRLVADMLKAEVEQIQTALIDVLGITENEGEGQ